MFDDAPAPRYTGQMIWRTMVPRPEEQRTYPIIFGPGGKLGLVPVSEEEMYVYLLQASPSDERPPTEDWADLLRGSLAGYNERVDAIREELIDPAKVDYRGLQALLVPPPWFSGRVVLIGDAAHTTTPHLAYGVGLAVEDSIVLADEVSRGDEADKALARFMARAATNSAGSSSRTPSSSVSGNSTRTQGADPRRVVEETFAAVAQPL